MLGKTEKNKDCEVNEIFQNSFFEDKGIPKKILIIKIRFYFKILILFDLISTKINLNRNKNLKKKNFRSYYLKNKIFEFDYEKYNCSYWRGWFYWFKFN